MSLFVECKADEALAFALGVARRDVEHALGRGRVCTQVSQRINVLGMIDEDPGAAQPPYLKTLKEQSREHGIPVLIDEGRKNSIIVLSPRLEDWLVQTTKSAGLKMTDFGFESDNGVQLHAEINQRLGSLQQLVKALLEAKSPRLLRLQSILKQA
ncbi:MAG TPA: hypothetical protein VMF08_10075 [Candidatus Sulfotelmatobacter sp.]|nr:hypothetical protein [Candidatus Sulfotelmatobacter sp.]